MDSFIDDIHYCVKNATFRPKNTKVKPRKPWITPAILKSIEHKELLYNIWIKNKHIDEHKTEYKIYEKILHKVIKAAKNNYEINKAEKSSKDSKTLWSYINEKLGNKTKKCKIEKIKIGNDVTTTDPVVMADEF